MKREKKKKMKFCLIAGRRLTVLRRTTYARFTRPAQLKQFNPEISGTMGNEVALNGFYWIPLIRRRKRRECSFSSWWRRRIGAQFDFSSDNKSWFTGARWFLKIIRFPFTFHENRFAIFSVLVFFFFEFFPIHFEDDEIFDVAAKKTRANETILKPNSRTTFWRMTDWMEKWIASCRYGVCCCCCVDANSAGRRRVQPNARPGLAAHGLQRNLRVNNVMRPSHSH